MPKYITPETTEEIVRLYTSGASMAQTAKAVGVTAGTVKSHLRRRGIEIDSARRKRRHTPQQEEEAVRLYQSGARPTDIVETVGLASYDSLYSILKKHGVRTRLSTGRNANDWEEYVNREGYVVVKVPADWKYLDTMRGGHGGNGLWLPKHRVVMANHLGRGLRPEEHVHHKDGNRANNEIENLQLRGHHGSGQLYRCCKCGSHLVEAVGL
jgi:transposase-like protein